MAKGKKITHQEFVSYFNAKNPASKSIELLGQYCGSFGRIKCRCKICNHIWEPIASSLLQGTGCPKCAKEKTANNGRIVLDRIQKPVPMPHEEFLKRFELKNPYSKQIQVLSEYKGATERIKCQCKKCGAIWNPVASALLQGQGCPSCSHSSTSFMEQFVFQALVLALGNEEVKSRDKKTIGKEIDIYLPNHRLGIEIGSWNWHKKTVEKDLEKQRICEGKGIRLIIVYDSCKEKLFINKDIVIFQFDLGVEPNHETLKSLVMDVLKIAGVCHDFSKEEWRIVEQNAYLKSMRITHEEFLQKLQENNPHYNEFIILNTYTRATDKIKCKCKKCGKEWATAACELLKGTGCPICQIKAVGDRRSKKIIIKEWRKNNPTGNKLQCEKQTGISRMTVYKWWNS